MLAKLKCFLHGDQVYNISLARKPKMEDIFWCVVMILTRGSLGSDVGRGISTRLAYSPFAVSVRKLHVSEFSQKKKRYVATKTTYVEIDALPQPGCEEDDRGKARRLLRPGASQAREL